MMIEFILDASEMEHPEPFEKATAILAQMKQGEYLHMLHRRIPFPLFDFCKALPLEYSLKEGDTTAYEIIIYFKDDFETLQQEGILS